MMIAAWQPFAAAVAMISGTAGGGAATIARSGAAGSSDTSLTARMPSISGYFGLTSSIGPSKPASRRFFRIIRPTDAGRGLAPTSAIVRGASSLSRR